MNGNAAKLAEKLSQRKSLSAVIGLGYVGLPLAVELANAGYSVVGVDVSASVVATINSGRSHIQDVPNDLVEKHVKSGRLRATTDPAILNHVDTISVCVPTPLNKIKDPDLSFVIAVGQAIRDNLRPGTLIILESTTYPGTTREVFLPILEQSGWKLDQDFVVCFSPERVDPGNARWHTLNTPKVIGGLTPLSLKLGMQFYGSIFETMVPVESAEAAELVKVYENTFRMINIALANEMAMTCDRLGLDVWGVIEAAATKPFGFMKFTPGPGLGGHCIPLDPHYLSWKMRTLQFKTRLIELASEINSDMPHYVVRKIASALNDGARAVRNSHVLIVGIAYKKNIDDIRESPALDIIRLLQEEGAQVMYHDPLCPVINDDGHTTITGLPMHSIDINPALLSFVDAVVVVTDHSDVNYQEIADHASLVIDTRGVMRGIDGRARVLGLSGVQAASAEMNEAALTAPVALAIVG